MNLIGMIKIKNVRKERWTLELFKSYEDRSNYGFSIHESLEYVKGNLRQNSLRLQMEMMKNLVR